MEGSLWFRRFKKELHRISPHFKLRRIKYGFYRIYWVGGGESAYIHEVYKEMPYHGYDTDTDDFRLESKKYYEQFEDRAELTRKIKNYVEGYTDSVSRIRKRYFMLRNNKEFRDEATKAYRKFYVK